MRKYVTVCTEAGSIGNVLNGAVQNVAQNIIIENVSGHNYVVYVTYSYIEEDEWVWTFTYPEKGPEKVTREFAPNKYFHTYREANKAWMRLVTGE